MMLVDNFSLQKSKL